VLDFLLPPAATPLLTPDTSSGDPALSSGVTAPTSDDDTGALAFGPVLVVHTPPAACPSGSSKHDHSPTSSFVDVMANNSPMHGTISDVAQGAARRAPASRHRLPPLVSHPVEVMRDERHTHQMVTRRSAGVIIKPPDRLNLLATMTPAI
jgi:hypothetical protein